MPLPKLDDITDLFQSVDGDTRLEFLLDYADKLPPLPPELAAARDAGMNRVPECVTPVFLWAFVDEGNMRMHVDVAEESPTVKGLMSIIVNGCDAEPPADVAGLPPDLLRRLGLDKLIGTQRTMGFTGILQRIRRTATDLAATASAS